MELQKHVWKELASISEQVIKANEWQRTAELEEHLATLEEVISVTANGKRSSEPTSTLVSDDLIFNLDSKRWAGTAAERLLSQKILLTIQAAYALKASAEDTLELVEGVLLK